MACVAVVVLNVTVFVLENVTQSRELSTGDL